MNDLRLVIFDVDGTLVDSQGDIVAAMGHAFEQAEVPMPTRATILSIVGLSLEQAMQRLAPDLPNQTHLKMVDWYKEAYMHLRAKSGAAESSPLYPGARAVLDILQAHPNTLLGVATGKSRRGLDKLLEAHALEHVFVTQQVSDHHPSKPNPSMIRACLSETGLNPDQAAMVGDTSFDMDMAAAADVSGIGVSWGYHPKAALMGAVTILDEFGALPDALDQIWGATA